MKKFLIGSIALFGLLCGGPGSRGDDFKPEEGYTVLFNGKDLTGWRLGKDELDGKTATDNKTFRVADGIMVVSGGRNENLYTTRDYNGDFHLKLEFRAAPRADSGVFLRTKQLQVRDYPTVGPYYKVKGFKDADWNELDITVTGTKAVCKCNGEVIEPAFKIPEKGGIGLQSERGKFEFRRIRVKVRNE